MAKLPNFIEKDRSLWSVAYFVFRESLRGAKKYSILRYLTAGLTSVFAFLEFGGLAIIVNEFSTRGIDGARLPIILGSFAIMVAADFIPSVVDSLNAYFWEIQADQLQVHLQSLHFDVRNNLDIGTIEQPEFQDMSQTVNQRAWNGFFSTINLVTNIIRNIVSVVIASIAILSVSPIIFAILLVAAIPGFFLQKKNAELTAEVWKEGSELSRTWGSKVSPTFGKESLTELKNFNLVTIFKKKFATLISGFHVKTKAINKKQFYIELASRTLLTIAFTLSFWFLIRGIYLGTVAIGMLVFSFSTISRFQSGLNNMFDNAAKLSEHKKYVSTLMDFLEMEPLIKSGVREINTADFASLEIKNVSFGYPGTEKNIIKNMNLHIRHTDNLAIVGLNGAGKTTLIKLLTRVYDPSEGEILVNGINLKEYDLKSWKKCLGILLQDYSIYSEESIKENIMLGDTSKHDDEFMKKVAEETTADSYIQELANKYDQKVGTEFRGGVELSKGQKQKLALSRVLYRNSPIIILDEPTAAIDALSEDTIFKSLRNNHKHQTRIIISHKFSNVRDADKIILIEHGTIIEEGSHDSLMQLDNGKYKELFNLQAEGYQDKPKRKAPAKPRKKKEVAESTTESAVNPLDETIE